MSGGILGGAFAGGVIGGIIGGVYALVMKRSGKPLGKRNAQPSEYQDTVPAQRTWKSELKRLLLGCLWFVVLLTVAHIVCGFIIGYTFGSHESSYNRGYSAGQTAAREFFQKYDLLIMLAVLVLAVVGTLTEFLPGTRRPRIAVPKVQVSTEGHWPPAPTGRGQDEGKDNG